MKKASPSKEPLQMCPPLPVIVTKVCTFPHLCFSGDLKCLWTLCLIINCHQILYIRLSSFQMIFHVRFSKNRLVVLVFICFKLSFRLKFIFLYLCFLDFSDSVLVTFFSVADRSYLCFVFLSFLISQF